MAIETNATENQPPVEQQNSKEVNFSALRKQLEQERAEKQQMKQRLDDLEKSQKQRETTSRDDEDDFSDEPYVDHRALSKKLAKWEEKIEQKIDRRAEEKARGLLEQERQNDYLKANPDFQEVLSTDNIQKFAEKHPAIAERMLRMPDGFDRQTLLYEQIKALNVGKKEEPRPSAQEAIDKNRKSVFYQPSSQGAPPYAQVGDFSEQGKKNAYQKLQELKSRLRLG